MHKFMKRALTIALAGVMTLGMGVGALAEDAPTRNNNKITTDGTSISSDIDYIMLEKDYKVAATSSNNAKNETEFGFTITPYGVWNAADGINKTTMMMPNFDGDSSDVNSTRSSTASIIVSFNNIDASSKTTSGSNTKKVVLPKYNSVGDYWYCIQETVSNNIGVICGTNDAQEKTETSANFGHNGTYYMHVQVTNNYTDNAEYKFYRSVTLHKVAPPLTKTDNNGQKPTTNEDYNSWANTKISTSGKKPYEKDNSTKIETIENEYYAGSLTIKKEVDGNAADKNKTFEVEVTFTKPAGKIINSTIYYSKGTDELSTILGQNATSDQPWERVDSSNTAAVDGNTTDELKTTVTINIKADETYTFNNIPYGVKYTVKEKNPNGTDTTNPYYNKIAYTATNDITTEWSGINVVADEVKFAPTDEPDNEKYSTSFEKNAAGSITDPTDSITITNKKNTSIDVGVILDNAPYVAILAIAAGALMIFLLRRKTTIEE